MTTFWAKIPYRNIVSELNFFKNHVTNYARVVSRSKASFEDLNFKEITPFRSLEDWNVSRFAYKSIRLHRGRFAYKTESFRLHGLSRFAYIEVVSPTLKSSKVIKVKSYQASRSRFSPYIHCKFCRVCPTTKMTSATVKPSLLYTY